jgi:hypothetical protein
MRVLATAKQHRVYAVVAIKIMLEKSDILKIHF